jgi:hypothetical protein
MKNEDISLAISGGGIRSATFSLGIIQALNKTDILKRIKNISTVSGGGFTGMFLGSLYYFQGKENIKKALGDNSKEIEFLRHNSNYLCPNGTKDYVSLMFKFITQWIFLISLVFILIFPFLLLARLVDIPTEQLFINNNISIFASVSIIIFGLFILPAVICSIIKESHIANLIPIVCFSLAAFYPDISIYLYAIGGIVFASLIYKIVVLYQSSNFEVVDNKLSSWLYKSLLVFVFFIIAAIVDTIGLFLYKSGHNIFYVSLIYALTTVSLSGKIINKISSADKSFKDKLIKLIINVLCIIPAILFLCLCSYLSYHIYFYDKSILSISLVIFVIIFGIVSHCKELANKCSIQKIFEDKIKRTYIRAASNNKNNTSKISSNDDIGYWEYIQEKPFVHFINSTINETINDKDQLSSIHRKGRHKVFNYYDKISIAKCISISAAATSPLMGYRTNIFNSILLFFLNIRLGYWQNNDHKQEYFGLLKRFLSECLASCRPSDKSFYLSDGGHFENLACYELIKNRAKNIIIIDAEYDPSYDLHGLANLIRKTKIDFNSDISIKDINKFKRNHFSSQISNIKINDSKFQFAQQFGFSQCNYLTGTINYNDGERGNLIYIKPALLGNESVDILSYFNKNKDFPQETTSDQFFSEEQWESYRKLGYEIGLQVINKEVLKHE